MTINYPLLLDGGLSNELERQGCDLNQKLWSAKLLESNPEAIVLAHLAYLEAGAQCIITSSYQATLPGFMALGYDQPSASALILKSVQVAVEARRRFMLLHPDQAMPLIAASIGPYGAYLANGSEYRGNYGISDQALTDFHAPRIELLDHSTADILACETIPSFQEAIVLSTILKNKRKATWISFSCKDGKHISDGTPIEECTALFTHHPTVFAVGVNCTAPQHISALIQRIKTRSGDKKIVVYPNSGAVYHPESKTWSGLSKSSSCEVLVKEWLNLGADIIGGCCGVGPEQIRSMGKIINQSLTMKKMLTMLFALFCALSLAAQSPMCKRDSLILGTDSLLWPLPYTATAPNYNLNDACIGHPYNQSVTINTPNSLMDYPITNVSIATSYAISNLPIGLTYACDPPNCVFHAGTLGCIVLYGTPTNANMAPDTFDLKILATVTTAIGFTMPTIFPGIMTPGSYYLTLKTPECLVGNYDLGNQFTLLKNAPNPFNHQTLITAESLVAGDFQFEVFDLLGQRLHMQKLRLETGRNEFTFDTGELANGAYFYTLSNREGKAVRRMIVAR